MMSTNIHLQKSAGTYNRFQPNQVLTDTQLNAMIDYFERQHRLSRSCLVGVGIACGLKLDLPSENQIAISKGFGLTTDGDLLHVDENLTFTQFSSFDDKAAKYTPFWLDDTQNVKLWELVDGSQDEDREVFSLNQFGAQAELDLNETVLIAYLDAFGKEGNICTPLDCNNQGIEQVAKLRFLLLNVEDMRRIINEQDTIYGRLGEQAKQYFNLPDIRAPRVVLDAASRTSSADLFSKYASHIAEDRDAFLSVLQQLPQSFGTLLDPENKIDTTKWEQHFDQLFPTVFTGKTLPLAIQYRHAHYTDLTLAYRELREALYQILVLCLPSNAAFPRHLMLGRLQGTDIGLDLDFRHAFYPSPVDTLAQHQLSNVRALYSRLHVLMASYADPKDHNVVRITPSANFHQKLGDRSIPYYYQPSQELLDLWNLEKYQRGQSNENLSYHAGDYAENIITTAPLRYDHGDLPFYRIEGHLGNTYGDAMEDLEDIRGEHGLNFDIVALRLGATQNDIDVEDYDVFFQDLQMLLTAWRAEQNCLLGNASKFFSGFSLKEPGQHIRYQPFLKAEIITGRSLENTGLSMSAGSMTMQPGFTFAGMQPATGMLAPSLLLGLQGTVSVSEELSLSRVYNTETKGNSVFTDAGQIKGVNNVIEESIEVEESTLGSQFQDILLNTKGSESATIRDKATDRITDFFDASDIDLSKFERDEVDLTIMVPANLISKLQYLSAQQPEGVIDFTPENISAYKSALQAVHKSIRVAKDKLLGIVEKEGRDKKGYESDYLLMLNQLEANVCSAKKMELLMEEFTARKQQLLQLTNFSNYAEKHPGLTHQGGVSNGGTFVMVYQDNETPKEKPSLGNTGVSILRPKFDILKNLSNGLNLEQASKSLAIDSKFNERSHLIAKNKGLSQNRSINKINREELRKTPLDFTNYVVDNHKLFNIEKTIKDYQTVTGISGDFKKLVKEAVLEGITLKGNKGREPNVPSYTIVADFCLPYRCCSNLPPMTIALPRERVNAVLDRAYICVPEDSDDRPARFPISITPSDGVLRAIPDATGLLVREDDKYFFEPQAITSDLFGETISFTVNDQETKAKLEIYREPVAVFNSTIGEPTDKGNIIYWSVQFNNETKQEEGEALQWHWNFGDGDSSTEQNPRHNFSVLTDNLKNNPEFKVTLTAINGKCTNADTQTITFDVTGLGNNNSECEEKGMEIILSDKENVAKLLESNELLTIRDMKELRTQIDTIYESLENDKTRKLLFDGRLNTSWNEQNLNIIENLDEMTNSLFSKNAEEMRHLSLLTFKLYIIPLSCQEKLELDASNKKVLNKYSSTIQRIKEIEPKWFSGNPNKQPGTALRVFLELYLEQAKFTDGGLISYFKIMIGKLSD